MSGCRRRAIDFVGEQEGGEDRAWDKGEFVFLEVEHARAGDVRGHEVGRELNARELAAEKVRQGADQQRLGDAGHALDQRVLADEDRDERLYR